MYETTADLNEDHYYASLDADLEMWEMREQAKQAEADRKAGNCWHGGGYLFRAEAFYPEQVGLTQGQMHCTECDQKVACDLDCHVCGLTERDCMGERGVAGDGRFAHDHFVIPPMVLVSVAPEGGF